MGRGLVIAVSGQVGAGKTTYAKRLAQYFKLRYVSNGALFRELAKELGVSLYELHKLAEKDPKYDLMIDERAKEEAKRGNVVIDGHLAAWVLEDLADIKIYLIAPLEVRAQRVAKRDNKSIEEALQEIKFREESNKKRCLSLYGKNMDDWSVFNIIVDTSSLSIDSVTSLLVKYVELWLEEHGRKLKNK